MRLNSEHPITTENKQKPAEYTVEVAAKHQRQRQRVIQHKQKKEERQQQQ